MSRANWISCDWNRRPLLQKTARATTLEWPVEQDVQPWNGGNLSINQSNNPQGSKYYFKFIIPSCYLKTDLIVTVRHCSGVRLFTQLLREKVSTNSPFFPTLVLNDLRVGKGKLLFKEICYLFKWENTPFCHPCDWQQLHSSRGCLALHVSWGGKSVPPVQ